MLNYNVISFINGGGGKNKQTHTENTETNFPQDAREKT